MSFSRRTAQLLHEDHQATVEVIEALDSLIARSRKAPPDTSDAKVRKALTGAGSAIEEEVSVHFAFEENELFTRLEAMGDVGIGMTLRGEHQALLPLGRKVADMARAALEDGFDDASWAAFRDTAGELIERMFAHIQKEEMALLPMLEEILDDEDDMALSELYSNAH
jgi:hemerythrin-like domain-containing protein